MVLFPNVDVDAASNGSSGRMLCRIRTHASAMCSCRLDDDDCVAECRVWRQILYRSWDRSAFLVLFVRSTRRHFDAVERVEAARQLGVAVDGAGGAHLVVEPLDLNLIENRNQY